MIIFSYRTVPWEDFIKQLEPEELKIYEGIRFMAKELEEPQGITIEGILIGLIWPSGVFQRAIRIPDDQPLTLNQFLGEVEP